MSDEPILNSSTNQQGHHAMGARLTSAIEEGKRSVPEIVDPLVSKPNQLETWRIFKIMSEFVEGFYLILKFLIKSI
jgi:hypothetical protein